MSSNTQSSAPEAPIEHQHTNNLTRSETRQTLTSLGVTENIPPLDFNYPDVGREDDPVFPEEYTLETATGFVPEEALEQIRTRATVRSRTNGQRHRLPAAESGSEGDLEKGSEQHEFVTFTFADSENPQNWPNLYRWYVTMVVSMLVVCVAYGSAIVTGGLGLIEEKYDVSLEVAILTCSIMVCGFAVGPLLWSPLSEIIGRRPVYIISLSLYVIFNIPCALSPNIGGLLVCRFLCGVFSSSGLSLAGGTIADIWYVLLCHASYSCEIAH